MKIYLLKQGNHVRPLSLPCQSHAQLHLTLILNLPFLYPTAWHSQITESIIFSYFHLLIKTIVQCHVHLTISEATRFYSLVTGK